MATIQVRLKSGEVVPMSHPDDWSDEQIESAIHENFPDEAANDEGQSSIPSIYPEEKNAQQQPQQSQRPNQGNSSFKELGNQALSYLSNTLSKGSNFGLNIPKMTQDLGEDLLEHPFTEPFRKAGIFGASIAQTGKDILNLGLSGVQNALTSGHEGLKPKLKIQIPEDTGLQKALGLEPNKKGDKIVNALPDILAGKAIVKDLTKKGVKALTAPNKEVLFKRALEDKISQAKKDFNLSSKEAKTFEDSLKKEYSRIHGERIGEVSPVGQEVSANIKEHELKIKEPLTKIPEKQIGEIPPEPNIKAITESKITESKFAREAVEKSLGILEQPRLKGGTIVQKAITDLKNKSSDLYNSARKTYVDQKIKASNDETIKKVTSELNALKDADELAPGYGSGSSEQKALQSQIDSLNAEEVNASDIFDLQRTVEKMAKDTRKKQYSGKVSDQEFTNLGNLAQKFDEQANILSKRLESVGGQEVQSMIKEANKGWKTYSDLKKNPVGRAALKKGDLPPRAMIDIANSQSGNEFLKSLTQVYPELKKHMLAAYVGESSVNKLLKPTTITKEYLKALPEVEEKVQNLKDAMAAIKEGKIEAQGVKKEYDDLVSSMKEAAKQQHERANAIKESEELKKQIKFHKDAIPKLKEKIRISDQKNENITKLKEELATHTRNMEDKNNKLKKLSNIILKYTGVGHLIHKVGL